MIVVAGRIGVDAGKREAIESAVRELMQATRAEAGNLDYYFTWDLVEPGLLRVFERWESQGAIDAHMKTPHMAKFIGSVGGFGLKGMDFTKYEVASSGPVF